MADVVRHLRAWSERVRARAQAQLAAAERFYLAMLDRAGIDVGPPDAPDSRERSSQPSSQPSSQQSDEAPSTPAERRDRRVRRGRQLAGGRARTRS